MKFTIPKVGADVVVLAGDIAEGNQTRNFFFQESCEEQPDVHFFYVPGNHEYYDGFPFQKTNEELEEFASRYENFTFLHNKAVVYKGVLFVGGTLWTDYANDTWHVREAVRQAMNDYRCIQYIIDSGECKKILPTNILSEFRITKDIISKALSNPEYDGMKKVVVTHHAPSDKSIDSRFGDRWNPENYGYFSDLDNLAFHSDLWIHGHTHTPKDYMIGGSARVVCNPRGYFCLGEITGYNPNFVVEV